MFSIVGEANFPFPFQIVDKTGLDIGARGSQTTIAAMIAYLMKGKCNQRKEAASIHDRWFIGRMILTPTLPGEEGKIRWEEKSRTLQGTRYTP